MSIGCWISGAFYAPLRQPQRHILPVHTLGRLSESEARARQTFNLP